MKIRAFIFGLCLMFDTSQAAATQTSLLVFDNTESQQNILPRNFRDLSGLGINAIASAQFSEPQLQEIRKNYPNDNITVVDLRGESHGFINGKAVAWRTLFERGNQGKNFSEVMDDETERLRLIARQDRLIINKTLQRDRINGWYKMVSPETIMVHYSTNEETLVKNHGLTYKRFIIRDFDKPGEKEFTRMVGFIKSLPHDQKLYVHCAGGTGRTTLFLVLLDIIKNGKNTDLAEIFKRQNALGGARLDEISDQEAWNNTLAQERLTLLKDFYVTEAARYP